MRCEVVHGVSEGLDFDAAYEVRGYRGIAWRLLGWEVEPAIETSLVSDEDGIEVEIEREAEGEWTRVPDRVVAVMVGDDRRHAFDVEDLTKIEDDAFCSCCGQVGCAHDGR